ncbi:MAG: GNAT family N-acetyltransferase [Alphaproteobacteria bacterium]|nr:GNAT family N-acetyltransferase [Alphaproteobacteria bacterium]
MTLKIRPAAPEDAAELADLINEIIAIGGTTAWQTKFTPETFAAHYIDGPDCLSCFVAEANRLYGFQGLSRSKTLPANWADIGSFARVRPKLPGVGAALFAATKVKAREFGLVSINAQIRADNKPGLGFYSKMGFVDYGVKKDVPLTDGAIVDRILKRYDL